MRVRGNELSISITRLICIKKEDKKKRRRRKTTTTTTIITITTTAKREVRFVHSFKREREKVGGNELPK